MSTRIIVVDDHHSVRNQICVLFEQEPGMATTHNSPTAASASKRLQMLKSMEGLANA